MAETNARDFLKYRNVRGGRVGKQKEMAEKDAEKTECRVLVWWFTMLGRHNPNPVPLGLLLPASSRHAALSRPEELSYEVINIQATQVRILLIIL